MRNNILNIFDMSRQLKNNHGNQLDIHLFIQIVLIFFYAVEFDDGEFDC